MSFKTIGGLFISSLLLVLTACGDAETEKKLVELFTAASQDLIEISFPVDKTEDIISIDTFFDYRIEGLKSNGVTTVPVIEHLVWSLSFGAISTIDQNGRLRTGSVAEVVTITAKLGHLIATQDVTVSAAKFDQVFKLNSTPVVINLCQAQQIKPIGSYLNDDGSQELRPVDNTIINTITWIITNQEDGTPSQRAFIRTVNSQANLQALEVGNVIIQAEALSVSSGNIVTSIDFPQTLGNNLNTLKLCLKSEINLAICSLNSADIVKDTVLSLQAVANYQAMDGSTFNQNVSAYSKWGVDDNTVVAIAFSADRQQLNVTGITSGSTASVSVACGDIDQTILDDDIKNGVVLKESVTCTDGNVICLPDTAAMRVIDVAVTSLSVTANGANLVDDSALTLTTRPDTITFNVTANFSDGSSLDVTSDAGTSYTNNAITVITGASNPPGEYTVLQAGDAEIVMTFQGETFIAKITIP